MLFHGVESLEPINRPLHRHIPQVTPWHSLPLTLGDQLVLISVPVRADKARTVCPCLGSRSHVSTSLWLMPREGGSI